MKNQIVFRKNVSYSIINYWLNMSYNEKKYLEEHKKTWASFISFTIKGCVIITILLILMAIFLTG